MANSSLKEIIEYLITDHGREEVKYRQVLTDSVTGKKRLISRHVSIVPHKAKKLGKAVIFCEERQKVICQDQKTSTQKESHVSESSKQDSGDRSNGLSQQKFRRQWSRLEAQRLEAPSVTNKMTPIPLVIMEPVHIKHWLSTL
jgi:hypothetical protein